MTERGRERARQLKQAAQNGDPLANVKLVAYGHLTYYAGLQQVRRSNPDQVGIFQNGRRDEENRRAEKEPATPELLRKSLRFKEPINEIKEQDPDKRLKELNKQRCTLEIFPKDGSWDVFMRGINADPSFFRTTPPNPNMG